MHRMAIFILMGHIRKTAGGERGSGRCRRGYQQRRTRDGRRRAAQLIGRKTHRHKGKQHQRLSLQRIAYGNRHCGAHHCAGKASDAREELKSEPQAQRFQILFS